MTTMILYALLLTIASLSWLMVNPLTMGLSILLMSMTISLLFASSLSSWMAFLIFLIYIGGMMVMFAYFVAMSPNMPMNMLAPTLFSLSTFILVITFSLISNLSPSTLTPKSSSLNTFYSSELYHILIILALTLLLTMIIVVKLVSLNKGPLRPFNYV